MNRLENLDEFKKILADYHVSDASKKTLRSTKLVLLVAPSSIGRNTLIRELQKTGEYHFIVSDTTRKPRVNDGILEKNGREYWFRSEEEMLNELKAGLFLEAAIIHNQQVSGISIRELEQARVEGKTAITDIEVVGVHNIMGAKPDAIALFVLPPSFEEWQRRIRDRGEMSPHEYRRRMESAAKELKAAVSEPYYKFVINDNLAEAVEHIHQIVQNGVIDANEQSTARLLAEQLYDKTKAIISN